MCKLWVLRYILFIILILCIHSNFIFGQEDNPGLKDNLAALDKYSESDSSKVNLLKGIGLQYGNSDPVQAKKYLRSAKNLAEKINFILGQITAYNDLGLICQDIGEYDSSIYYHLKSLKLCETIRDNVDIARNYASMGYVYENLRDSIKSLYYLKKSLEISEKFKYTQSVGLAYMNIGGLYQGFKQNTVARTWYLKALEIFQQTHDNANLAKVYNNIGILFSDEGKYKTALVYYFQDAFIEKEINNSPGLARVYTNIATAYSSLNKDSALYYYNLAIGLAQKIKNPSLVMGIEGSMVNFYIDNHDYKRALDAFEQYDSLKETIFNIDKAKSIADMQTKYETEKKEQQIAILTGDRKFQGLLRNFLIVGLTLILIIALIMINRYRFERKVNRIIEAQKERSDQLLLNILPEETAEELKKYGKTSAKNYDEVTVLFADIKGFSIISQQMTAQALVADLDKYFGAFDLISEKYRLEKIKTIGDAYLCAGGLPDPKQGIPGDVVMAGIEMQQYVETIKLERLAKNELYFEMRVGIHTGPVVAGVVGIKKFAYDIWGDTVNTAARMEQYGEVGKINISEDTYNKVKDHFNCISRGNIEVKNKGLFAMYFVEGIRSPDFTKATAGEAGFMS